ncbi:VOC family protein [Acinetobacter sp.]|uniref:VOC family protein n=1 Tax=Acinetobacter sp. TaxID=472 RepID=UPI0035B48CDB
MTNYIAANLPAIDFAKTITFYQQLGFEVHFQSDQWLILQNDQSVDGTLEIEFFPYPSLDSKQSYFSASVWVKDVDTLNTLYTSWSKLDWSNYADPTRITEIEQMGQLHIFNVIDVNGSLLRCMSLS